MATNAWSSPGARGPVVARPAEWRVILVWGILSCALGLLLIVRPTFTALTFVRIMAAFWLLGGIVDVMAALTQKHNRSAARPIVGILSIVAGATLLSAGLFGTKLVLPIQYYLLGFVALIYGAIMMLMQKPGPDWSWGQFALGMLQVLIGIALLAHPSVGILGFLGLIGLLIMSAGIFAIISSLRLRGRLA